MIKLISSHLNALKEFLPALFEPLAPAVLLGVFCSWRRRRDAGYFLLLVCFAMALTSRLVCGVGVTRYYAFSSVFGVILSAVGLCFLPVLLRKFVSRRVAAGVTATLIAVLAAAGIIRVFTFQHPKPFLREYGEAIVRDCRERNLRFPRVLVANGIGMYLEYYHRMKSQPIELDPGSPIELGSNLDDFDGIYDGVYLVLDLNLTPEPRLKIAGNREMKLIFQSEYRKRYVAVYFWEGSNIGNADPPVERCAELLPNGDFEQSPVPPPSHAARIAKRGYALPLEHWPAFWNVNASHYWDETSASPDAGIFIVRTDNSQSMRLQSRNRITVLNDSPLDLEKTRGVEFLARGTPGTVFRIFIFGRNAQQYVFYCSRNLSTVETWRHYRLLWSDDFAKLSEARLIAPGKAGIEFKQGDAEFDQFKIIPLFPTKNKQAISSP